MSKENWELKKYLKDIITLTNMIYGIKFETLKKNRVGILKTIVGHWKLLRSWWKISNTFSEFLGTFPPTFSGTVVTRTAS
jgi:hypothetical protein